MSSSCERVLVIDDEPLITQMLHRMLRRRFQVSAASDGQAALELLHDGSFELVICDLMMTPLSGMEVYEQVRGRFPRLAERFVLMTGGACTRPVEQFLETWPHPVLFKPFAAPDVDRILAAALARVASAPVESVG